MKEESMQEEFVPYEEALTLEALGFETLNIFGYYVKSEVTFPIDTNGITAITVIGEFMEERHNTFLRALHGDKYVSMPAPLYQQVFRWVREKHGLNAVIAQNGDNTWYCYIQGTTVMIDKDDFSSHEEAELECIRELIKIVKAS